MVEYNDHESGKSNGHRDVYTTAAWFLSVSVVNSVADEIIVEK